MIKITCSTLFDITATGITGHYKSSAQQFKDIDKWNRARNQQRNWETLTQLIQLRTQIVDLQNPICKDAVWSFEFTTETEVFNDGTDPVGILKQDSADVPMLRELDNRPNIESVLVISGPDQNIWFTAEPINNILEN